MHFISRCDLADDWSHIKSNLNKNIIIIATNFTDDRAWVFNQIYKIYLNIQTSRNTARLKILHGRIAEDIKHLLGEKYDVKSKGIGDDKEVKIRGRYYDKMLYNYK